MVRSLELHGWLAARLPALFFSWWGVTGCAQEWLCISKLGSEVRGEDADIIHLRLNGRVRSVVQPRHPSFSGHWRRQTTYRYLMEARRPGPIILRLAGATSGSARHWTPRPGPDLWRRSIRGQVWYGVYRAGPPGLSIMPNVKTRHVKSSHGQVVGRHPSTAGTRAL